MVTLPNGLAQHHAAPLQLAVQRQWGLVMQRMCVWRRPLAVHAYWELASSASELSADYSHALQFVDWSPADEVGRAHEMDARYASRVSYRTARPTPHCALC